MFRSRSTIDVVVLSLTFIIGFVIIFGLVGVVAIELIRPEVDTTSMVRLEAEILWVLVGALVGFVGGRSDRSGREKTHDVARETRVEISENSRGEISQKQSQ